MNPVVYSINDQDRICGANAAWSEFAIYNGGEAVLPHHVMFRPLWDFIGSEEVRTVYRRLISRARAGLEVRFTFRCDSSDYRRLFEMVIARKQEQVEFCSTLLAQEKRAPIPLFDTARERSDQILRVCGWCHAVAGPDGDWLELETAVQRLKLLELPVLPRISHGICEPCAAKFLSNIPWQCTGTPAGSR